MFGFDPTFVLAATIGFANVALLRHLIWPQRLVVLRHFCCDTLDVVIAPSRLGHANPRHT